MSFLCLFLFSHISMRCTPLTTLRHLLLIYLSTPLCWQLKVEISAIDCAIICWMEFDSLGYWKITRITKTGSTLNFVLSWNCYKLFWLTTIINCNLYFTFGSGYMGLQFRRLKRKVTSWNCCHLSFPYHIVFHKLVL